MSFSYQVLVYFHCDITMLARVILVVQCSSKLAVVVSEFDLSKKLGPQI